MFFDMDDFQMFSWLLILQFVYGVISTLIYTLTVIILFKNWKHFDVYFFKIYVYQYFFNMLMYWNYYITARLPSSTCEDCTLSPWFFSMSSSTPTFSFPFFVSYFLHYHFGFVNYANVLLTSFNRYTMIFMNKSYAQIWHYASGLLIVFVLVLPLVFTYPLLTNHAYFEFNPSSDTFVARSQADISQIYSVLLAWMIIAILLNIVLNAACWFRISKYSQISRQKSEYRLFLVSFVTFLIQCCVFGMAILNKISADMDPSKTLLMSRIGQVLSPFGNDLLTLSAPYVLVVFSRRIRESIKFLFVKGKFPIDSSTPVQNIRVSRSVNSKVPAT